MSETLGPDIEAANQFRASIITKIDDVTNAGAPLWGSWAIRKAFIAGADHGRAEKSDLLEALREARGALEFEMIRSDTQMSAADFVQRRALIARIDAAIKRTGG